MTPGLIFLDEPTSGLVRYCKWFCTQSVLSALTYRSFSLHRALTSLLQDAYNSLVLVNVLRRLADAGRAVVCTIHQPRPDIFKYEDVPALT